MWSKSTIHITVSVYLFRVSAAAKATQLKGEKGDGKKDGHKRNEDQTKHDVADDEAATDTRSQGRRWVIRKIIRAIRSVW